jgi:hypothetical protein
MRHSFTNLKLADWAGFVKESEELFSSLLAPTSCAKGERKFWAVLLSVSKYNIPSGFRKNFIPGLPNSAKTLISQRDTLRACDPADPGIPPLNDQISEAIRVFSSGLV